MHLDNFLCISLASHSQPILIKFALKLFVCKCLSFQTHLLLDLRFPLKLEISMRPICLLMIFSTPYTTLPHNLVKDKLIGLIERTFQREGSLYLACNDRNAFLLRKSLKNIMHGHVKMYMKR